MSNVDYVIQQEYAAPARAALPKPSAAPRKPNLLLLSWIAPVVLVIVWETLARIGWLSPQVLPAPSKVLLTAWKLTVSGSLLNDLGVSMLRAAAGFAIGNKVMTLETNTLDHPRALQLYQEAGFIAVSMRVVSTRAIDR